VLGEVVEPPAATEWTIMLASTVLAISALFVAYYAYVARPELPVSIARAFGPLYRLAYNKYYVDELYVGLIVNPLKRLANWLAWVLDMRVIDGIANGLASAVAWLGGEVRQIQTGYVRSYALAILTGVVLLLAYILLK
jgi:NADH-quinone oxidoreductase subunit L